MTTTPVSPKALADLIPNHDGPPDIEEAMEAATEEKTGDINMPDADDEPSPPSNTTIPLDSPQRTTPIHPLLPMFKMPDTNETSTSHLLHPATLQPLSDELISAHLPTLQTQYTTPEAAAKARDELAGQLKVLIDESLRKREEIDREIEKATKQRDMERRVYNKMMEMRRAKATE